MRIGFTGYPLDRADRTRTDADALAAACADPAARLLELAGGDPKTDADGRLFWRAMTIADLEVQPIFLGLADGVPHFACVTGDFAGGGTRSRELYRLLEYLPAEDAAIFGTARVLADWHARHQHCARCGQRDAPIRGGWGRKCPNCTTEHFPRVDPVVIMLAEHEGRALVGRGHPWPPGRYSALAGFVEPGESVEEAVAREVLEETGVRVAHVRYVASQPWPFPGQLMIGCFATAEGDALTLDAAEIQDAMWVTRDEVRAALAGESDARFIPPPAYAIARTLLEQWIACRASGH